MRTDSWISLLVIPVALVVVLAGSPVEASEPAAGGAQILTNATVVTLQKSGLGDNVILELMKTSRCQFETGIPAILELKAGGVGDEVIAGMLQAMQGKSVNGPGNMDLNDPLVPHSSGIYLYTEQGGQPKMTPLEPASFVQQKTGGAFAYAMSWGIAKIKMKGVLAGDHAVLQTDDTSPVFYFYFDQSSASLNGSGSAFWGQATSPNEFVLAATTLKAGNRELTYGQANSFGSQAGTMSNVNREFKFERVADGVYRVTPNALSQGEYCFYSAAGAGGGSVGRLFDFGVRSSAMPVVEVAVAVAPLAEPVVVPRVERVAEVEEVGPTTAEVEARPAKTAVAAKPSSRRPGIGR